MKEQSNITIVINPYNKKEIHLKENQYIIGYVEDTKSPYYGYVSIGTRKTKEEQKLEKLENLTKKLKTILKELSEEL